MRHEFTAIYEHDGDWIIAYCPEVPGANGQGRTKEEARDSLAEAIALILEDRRDDSLWMNPSTGSVEAVPRHTEVPNVLARKICRGLGIPELGTPSD